MKDLSPIAASLTARYASYDFSILIPFVAVLSLLVLLNLDYAEKLGFFIAGLPDFFGRWIGDPLAHGIWIVYLSVLVLFVSLRSPLAESLLRSSKNASEYDDVFGFRKVFEAALKKKAQDEFYGSDDLDVETSNAEIPRSDSEARQHIERIREEKGVNGPAGPTKDLTQALNM